MKIVAFEQRVRGRAELAPGQHEKVIDGDKLTQASGVTNQPAADHIGFKKVKGGYVAHITEITTGNKPLDQVARQLGGGMKVAQADRELGHLTNKFEFRIMTDTRVQAGCRDAAARLHEPHGG